MERPPDTTLAARNIGADRRLDCLGRAPIQASRASSVSAVRPSKFAVKWKGDVPERPRLRRIAIQFRKDIFRGLRVVEGLMSGQTAKPFASVALLVLMSGREPHPADQSGTRR
jgi:hypothetical protein